MKINILKLPLLNKSYSIRVTYDNHTYSFNSLVNIMKVLGIRVVSGVFLLMP